MYYDYFGFNQPPFKITPDTNLFYSGGDRGAILDALRYAILNGEGIVKVVGEVGSGKTMLCRMLEKELPENVEVVYLVNPSISPENTLHAIAFELKLAVNSGTSRFEVMNQLQKYLLARHSENRQVVVFVEEAQSMPIATLEEIRLLSNLETQQSKLLQIVLFGQPELDEMIARPEIRQLKERITYSFQLTPFKTNDIREYINTRVRACGHRSGELFDEASLKQIEHYSKGLLRRINILADKSLLAAFAENSHKVTGKHTRLAARDSEFVPSTIWFRRPAVVLSGISLAVVMLIAAYFLYPVKTGQSTTEDTAYLSDMTATPPVQTRPLPESTVEMPVEPLVERVPEQADAATPEVPVGILLDDGIIQFDQGQSALASEPEAVLGKQADTVASEGQPLEPYEASARDEATKPLQAQENNLETEQQVVKNQLLGVSQVYPMLDISDARLTEGEVLQLRRQIQKLPPESAEYMSLEGDICERCWSFIYRPIWSTEKL